MKIVHDYPPENNLFCPQAATDTFGLRSIADRALGEFLTEQSNYKEAEPMLLKAYESLKMTQDPDSPRIKSARQSLVTFYEKEGAPETANKYRSSP